MLAPLAEARPLLLKQHHELHIPHLPHRRDRRDLWTSIPRCAVTAFVFHLKSIRAHSLSLSLPLPLPLAADPSDAARLGYYGEDYEGNLCGQTTIHADGSRGRDLRSRPYAYWMNSSAAVCVRRCPRLADELACEYPFEAVPIAQQRQQLGSRCFSQIRTRPSFPACLPHQPAAAAAVDGWLSAHAVDQLAAVTLQA